MRSGWAAVAIGLIVALASLSGCGPFAGGEPKVAERSPAARRETADTRTTPVRAAAEVVSDSPADIGERVSQQIARSLEQLRIAVESDPPRRQRLLADLLAESLQIGPLVPGELDVVSRGEVWTVWRATPPSATGPPAARDEETGSRAEASNGRSQEAVAAFEKWLAHHGGERHLKAKIFHVTTEKNRATTDLDVVLASQSADQATQTNARWRAGWRFAQDRWQLETLRVIDFELVQQPITGGTRLVDRTATLLEGADRVADQLSVGLDYWLDRLPLTLGITASGYQGIAIGDLNGDGWDDLFVPQPGGLLTGLPNRLLIRSQDGGQLLDVSAQCGLDWITETHSGLFVDLDNDGDQDMVVATVMGIVFVENLGGRIPQMRVRVAKLTPDAPPMSLTASDFDLDGDLDIYACCYSRRTSFEGLGRPIPYHDANNGGRNVLFANQGDWRFRNVTRQVGLDANNRRFSFAAAWEDYDNDGDSDLYVANDYGRNNLYQNQAGHFVDVAGKLGVEDMSAGMSVTWGDYDADGWMDIYVSNMWSSAGNRIAYQRGFRSDTDATVRDQFRRHARGNSLFRNAMGEASRTFQDVSLAARVTRGRWAWGSLFADLDNDSRQDLLVANGFITQEDTRDL